MCGNGLLSDVITLQGLHDGVGIVTADHFSVYQNHRHAGAMQLFKLALSLGGIVNVVFEEGDMVSAEELASPGAVVTPRCAIENDIFFVKRGKIRRGVEQGMYHSPSEGGSGKQCEKNSFPVH